MPRQHIWTEKDSEGKRREVRATKFGGTWRLQSKMHGDDQWTYYDVPLPADLLTLQGIIERKYRRRRATADDVVAVEKLIQDHESNE